MAAETHQLEIGTPLSSHAFNHNRTKLAVSPNSNEVMIYARDRNGFSLEYTLPEVLATSNISMIS